MTSAPESQSITSKIPENIDNCISYGAATGGLSGFAFGIYEGVKVAGCAASGCSLCCVETCCTCTYKSLYCFGITAAGYTTGYLAGVAAGLALGYCSSDANAREACLKTLVSSNSTSHNTNDEPSHSVEPVEVMNSNSTAEHHRGNETIIVTSQPTARYPEIINGSVSSSGHLMPEVQYTSDATAININNGNGHNDAGDDQVALLYFAPPSYASSVGPPPNYDDTQYHKLIPDNQTA